MKRAWAIGLLFVLAACGGGDETPAAAPSDSSPAVTPSSETSNAELAAPEDALEQAYRDYIAAFLGGDGATAYALLSERCRDATPLSEFAAAAESAAELYGQVSYTIDEVKVDGDTGTIDATYPVEALNSGGGSEWVLEDGQWRSDKCG